MAGRPAAHKLKEARSAHRRGTPALLPDRPAHLHVKQGKILCSKSQRTDNDDDNPKLAMTDHTSAPAPMRDAYFPFFSCRYKAQLLCTVFRLCVPVANPSALQLAYSYGPLLCIPCMQWHEAAARHLNMAIFCVSCLEAHVARNTPHRKLQPGLRTPAASCKQSL